jgi:glutathione S-transferase
LLSFPLIAGRDRAGLTKAKYPKLYDYIDSLREAPGYLKAKEKIIEIEGSFDESL